MSEPPLEPWKARLISAETRRADHARHWSEELPRLYRDDLVPTLHEFLEALASHVSAALIEEPSVLRATLRFDDWHLDEWTMAVRLKPTALDRVVLEIRSPGPSIRCLELKRGAAWDRMRLLETLADAYIGHALGPGVSDTAT